MAITPRALHVGASNCSNLPIAIGLAGTVTPDNTSVTFTALDPYTANQLNGTLASSDLAGDIAQRVAQALKRALKSRKLSHSTRPAVRPNRPPLKNADHTDRRR